MAENLEQLKQSLPLLDYLRRSHWTARRLGATAEFVGLCPFHRETRPSFYVNGRKNLFYCHGCGRGGDLIRFIQLSQGLSFRQTVAYLHQQIAPLAAGDALEQAAAFYQLQLHRHAPAVQYLQQRGLHDPLLIEQLGIGYAPGGNLRQHLSALGYSFELLLNTGLITSQGRDAFCRRIIFPCRHQGRIVNLYGRSIGSAFPHRLLSRSKGGLFSWEALQGLSTVILVEGWFDLAVLWQAGFRNTTCSIGAHLTPTQWNELCDSPGRSVYIVFDQDENRAGQQASLQLARRLLKAGCSAHIVHLPAGHDPNSYFVAGATAADFSVRLQQAQRL